MVRCDKYTHSTHWHCVSGRNAILCSTFSVFYFIFVKKSENTFPDIRVDVFMCVYVFIYQHRVIIFFGIMFSSLFFVWFVGAVPVCPLWLAMAFHHFVASPLLCAPNRYLFAFHVFLLFVFGVCARCVLCAPPLHFLLIFSLCMSRIKFILSSRVESVSCAQ